MVKNIRLQPRDTAILDHIARYRITTFDVLHHRYFDGRKTEAVRSTIRRLRAAQYVDTAKLSPEQSYIFFTRHGARRCKYPIHLVGPLGEQALLESYGVLGFCCLDGTVQEKLNEGEYKQLFPELLEILQRYPCYIDRQDGTKRLGCIYVDQGTSSRGLIRKCQQLIDDHRHIDAFLAYILDDAFIIGIATSENSKKEDILLAASKGDLPAPVRPVVVKGLDRLISQPK